MVDCAPAAAASKAASGTVLVECRIFGLGEQKEMWNQNLGGGRPGRKERNESKGLEKMSDSRRKQALSNECTSLKKNELQDEGKKCLKRAN
jgi:hypothetical protein